jgi:hypothetical protein
MHWYIFTFVFDVPVFSILFLRLNSPANWLSTSKHHFNNFNGCVSLLEPGELQEIEYQVISIAE